ncbi:putative autophagy-related protein 11 isoform X2 [Adelges cooleyi]|uniref:putative autophagy-related protein 11 isoform X2 n=1 Tax=Adelges cooleyi TaxID=133065 RepID=UPI00218008D5|nr:putative autophagy-related protein 11 isoform X2 [Adelges cooleyi]
MDEDKNGVLEPSDKRKIDDDIVNSKPNTKRIKLVRPVFSALSKPAATSNETAKPNVDLSESCKTTISTEKPSQLTVAAESNDITVSSIQPESNKSSDTNEVTLIEDEKIKYDKDLEDLKGFSDETKKQLEQLKKTIFKIEDDGSSSENDGQPKRPRLKRPTFILSTTEKKEPCDDINESKTEIISNPITASSKEIEKTSIKGSNDEKIKEINNDKLSNSITANEVNVNNLSEKFCMTESKPVVDNEMHPETVILSNVKEHTDAKNNQVSTDAERDIKKVDEIVDKVKIYDKKIEVECINDTVEDELPKEKKKLVEVVKKNIVKIEASNQVTHENVDCDEKLNEIIDEEISEQKDITFKTGEKNKIDKIVSNMEEEDENECEITHIENNHQEKHIFTTEDKVSDDTTHLLNVSNDIIEKQEVTQSSIKDENKCKINKNNLLTKQTEINMKMEVEEQCEENKSELYMTSDILKAALTSKKLLEPVQNTSKVCDIKFEEELKTVKNDNSDILPKIGEEAIINKIEISLTNITKSQPLNLNILPVAHINNKASSSSSLNEIDKNSEPPKWGSAKMNEVEKFLNDSNVTITPISTSPEKPKLNKITLKLPKVGNPEIKSDNKVRPDVKSELLKKITNKQISVGDSPLKNALSQPSKPFSDFATIKPSSKPSAEEIALLEQQILNTPKKRGRPSKLLAQQKQLLLQYQMQQQHTPEGIEDVKRNEDDNVFHVPLFDMDTMSSGNMFDSFEASTPKRGKSNIRGRGRGRGRGGRERRGREETDIDNQSNRHQVEIEENIFSEEMIQDEETKQVAKMEAERVRKEEERERKLEARKRKLKERNDLLKEKKLRKKRKAEERRLQWHEKKRLMQEEKARQAEMKKSLPPPQNFDDETRMSADISLTQTPSRNFIMGEDDLSISGTTNDSIRLKKGRMEVIDLESNKTLTVDQIAEYQWPLEGGELCMIQEQISNFLGVKSFKRKYPLLKRRNVEAEERTFLCDSGLVAETLCDLGLTVLYSSEVLDVMYVDFPEKYEELREYMRVKHAKELSNRQKALVSFNISTADGSKLDLRDRAMEAAANWNANFNKSRSESRKCTMDMQSFIVHYPKNKCKKMAKPKQKIGDYPLALLPGQFCDYYATYSNQELRYLPINTVMYGPLKVVDKDFPISLSSQSESDDSSSDDSSDSDESVDVNNKLTKNDYEMGPSDRKGAECKLCIGNSEKNSKGTTEPLIHCSKCLSIYHPTCLEMSLEMIPHIKRYNWQCNDCKSCAQCKEAADEDKMLFCDLCDRGYHIYCVGLRKVPEGRWHCQECAMCSSCGITDPGPGDSKWFYEFKKVEKSGTKMYSRTLCTPCSRMYQQK